MVHRLRLVERVGSGVGRVKDILGKKVSFDIGEDWFRVSIKRVGTQSGTVNDTVFCTVNDTEKKILLEMQKNPRITYDKLESKVGKSRRTIIRAVDKLKENGIVKRVGSDKSGHWEVTK